MTTESETNQEVKKSVYIRKGESSKCIRLDGVFPPRNAFEAIRRNLYLIQESFGKKLGLSRSLVNQYESGRSSPTLRTWMKMRANAERNGIDLPDDLYVSFMKAKSERLVKKFDIEVERMKNRVLSLQQAKE